MHGRSGNAIGTDCHIASHVIRTDRDVAGGSATGQQNARE